MIAASQHGMRRIDWQRLRRVPNCNGLALRMFLDIPLSRSDESLKSNAISGDWNPGRKQSK